MNLVVAKGIPSLADLEISRYQTLVNKWVQDFTVRCLPEWEPYFHKSPGDYRNDIQYFRLGMICQYLEQQIGVQYIQDQREVTAFSIRIHPICF